MDEKSKKYEYWLHALPGVGNRRIARLLAGFGTAEEVYRAQASQLEKVLGKKHAAAIRQAALEWKIEEKYEEMVQKGISMVTLADESYPARLRLLVNPPYALYYKGKLPGEEPAAAIIGARECSQYGRFVAEGFGKSLARAKVAVISGMARGIDGIAQQAAVKGGGKTYAVLGSGVDVCYPASNRSLYEQILSSGGGVLSVFPPGTQPARTHFPERNRIVAGLSDLLLVVEARQKSGTWITVDMALEQGKNIYAVPGRLTDRLSDGCNLLIRQGAGIALAPQDLIEELALLHNREQKTPVMISQNAPAAGSFLMERVCSTALSDGQDRQPLPQRELTQRVLNCLDLYPLPADEIRSRVRERYGEVELPGLLAELIELCMEGRAKQAAGNYFMRTAGAED